MNRLFIAISLPCLLQQGLAGLGRGLPRSTPVAAEQLHLTLRFIGEVEGGRQLAITGCLADIRHSPFSLQLQGVGCFPPRGEPRVAWVGITPWEPLLSLRAAIDKELAAIGIAREKSRFVPHITIARLKGTPQRHLQQFLAGHAFLNSEPFPVNQFSLYQSRLTAKGAKHEEKETYPLVGLLR